MKNIKTKAHPVVSSYNEWDPLEEVIVGVLDGATIPEWHIQLEATMPKKFLTFNSIFLISLFFIFHHKFYADLSNNSIK